MKHAAAGFGLYVHWPFCAAKCPYCDFNSHVVGSVDHERWRRALIREMRSVAELTDPAPLTSIFLGGGTPSLMAPETVGAIIDEAARLWTLEGGAEITLEANPTSAEAAKFAAFRAAGVNRVSVGLQALDDRDLRRLGRQHDAAEGIAAVTMARRVMDRVSFDVIYARQDQTEADWRDELARILDLGPDHLSLYQLTIEDGTVFGRRQAAGRLPGLPDDDRACAMFEITQQMCRVAGLPRYETSNHAAPGSECRHNLIYWRGGSFAAVGPGAHGRLEADGTRFATRTRTDPAAWLAAVEAEGAGFIECRPLSATDTAEEYLLMSLRLTEGCDLERHAALGGAPIDTARIEVLVESGHLRMTGRRIACTDRGMLVLDHLLGQLAA